MVKGAASQVLQVPPLKSGVYLGYSVCFDVYRYSSCTLRKSSPITPGIRRLNKLRSSRLCPIWSDGIPIFLYCGCSSSNDRIRNILFSVWFIHSPYFFGALFQKQVSSLVISSGASVRLSMTFEGHHGSCLHPYSSRSKTGIQGHEAGSVPAPLQIQH